MNIRFYDLGDRPQRSWLGHKLAELRGWWTVRRLLRGIERQRKLYPERFPR